MRSRYVMNGSYYLRGKLELLLFYRTTNLLTRKKKLGGLW